jgi:hypothetical protein
MSMSFTYFFFLSLSLSYPLTRELAPILKHIIDYSVSRSFTGGRIPRTGDQRVARPLPKHRTTHTQKNARTHSKSISNAGFEPAITVSERPKTVHASDRSVTETDIYILHCHENFRLTKCNLRPPNTRALNHSHSCNNKLHRGFTPAY